MIKAKYDPVRLEMILERDDITQEPEQHASRVIPGLEESG
jgi:hypothetical protein